jgi:thiol-disulfide isomerase/thioredoxin
MPSAEGFFALTLDDLEDKPLALESLRGRPIIVNFWARWCGPCREEIPELVHAYGKQRSKGLAMVGVALEENTLNVKDFATAYKMDYLVLLAKDKGLGMMQALGNNRAVLPYTIAIDRSGKVVDKKIGVLKNGDLDRMLSLVMPK